MKFSLSLCGLLATLIAACPVPAAAVADEIQVYTEEMDEPGTFGLELHLNHALKGARTPSYDGELPSHHVLQATPEFSYGLTPNLEAGLYLPVARAPDGRLYGNGLRARLKFIAPRDADDPVFWGLNGELGTSSRRVAESRWGLEFRPIVGYRNTDWLLAFNPILNMDLSSNVSRAAQFEPALKASRRVAGELHAGFEYYGEYGPLSRLSPANERSHYLYGVIDVEVKGIDINLGLGRGFVNAGDRWVAKAIVAFPFK